MASQRPRAVVVRPEALEDVPVEGVVVLERKSVKELEEGQRQDDVTRFFHLELGHGKNLVHPEKLGVLWRERRTGNYYTHCCGDQVQTVV